MRIRAVTSTVAIMLAVSGAAFGASAAHGASTRPASTRAASTRSSSTPASTSKWKIVDKHRWTGPDEEGVEGRAREPRGVRVYTKTTKSSATVNWDNNCTNAKGKPGSTDKHGTYRVRAHKRNFHMLPLSYANPSLCLAQTTSYLNSKGLFGHPKGYILQEIQRR